MFLGCPLTVLKICAVDFHLYMNFYLTNISSKVLANLYFAWQSRLFLRNIRFIVTSQECTTRDIELQCMRIARTDLVSFMIDDLVESSLGFLKRKKKTTKKIEKKCVILRRNIAFVLKSILCIINIVDCIVRGYIINIWYAWGNYRKTARNKTIVRYPSRERNEKKTKKRGKKSKSQYDDIFSQLISAKFFQSNHWNHFLIFLGDFRVETYV